MFEMVDNILEGRQGYYYSLNAIYSLSGLDVYCRDVYQFLRSIADDKGESWWSLNSMKDQLGIAKNTLIKALNKLIEKKLIIKQHRYVEADGKKVYGVNHYWVVHKRVKSGSRKGNKGQLKEGHYYDMHSPDNTVVDGIDRTKLSDEDILKDIAHIAKEMLASESIEVKGNTIEKQDVIEALTNLDKRKEELIERVRLIKRNTCIVALKKYIVSTIYTACSRPEYRNKSASHAKSTSDWPTGPVKKGGSYGPTKFHNFEQVAAKYTNEELERIWRTNQ